MNCSRIVSKPCVVPWRGENRARLPNKALMFVGVARFELFLLTQPHSLKEKRAIVNRLKDAIRNRLQLSVAEVDAQDVWQRAVLGVVSVSPEQNAARKMLEEAAKVLLGAHEIEITSEEIDVESW